jgi:hypothetical protein
VEPHGVPRTKVDHVQDLLRESTVSAERRIVDVLPLKEDIQIVADVIAGAEVDLGIGVDERGLLLQIMIALPFGARQTRGFHG